MLTIIQMNDSDSEIKKKKRERPGESYSEKSDNTSDAYLNMHSLISELFDSSKDDTKTDKTTTRKLLHFPEVSLLRLLLRLLSHRQQMILLMSQKHLIQKERQY
jgi:CBS domain containing-hemolysin-like protein